MNRHIDRAKLNLKMNYKDNNIVIGDTERMKQLIDMWWNADTIIGKILSFVYEHENGVSEAELKDYLHTNKYSKAWHSDLEQKHKDYQFVFERSHGITKLKQQALQYIKSK